MTEKIKPATRARLLRSRDRDRAKRLRKAIELMQAAAMYLPGRPQQNLMDARVSLTHAIRLALQEWWNLPFELRDKLRGEALEEWYGLKGIAAAEKARGSKP